MESTKAIAALHHASNKLATKWMNPTRIGLDLIPGLTGNQRVESSGEAIRPRELRHRTNQSSERRETNQTPGGTDGRIYHREVASGSCAIEVRGREREETKYLDLDRRAGGAAGGRPAASLDLLRSLGRERDASAPPIAGSGVGGERERSAGRRGH